MGFFFWLLAMIYSGPLEVGECSAWAGGERLCRGGEGWYVIEILDYKSAVAAIAHD